ncbi:MAG: glycosyltransferase family 4 protein [Chloroflexota bacterium]
MSALGCPIGFVSTRFSGTDGVSLETEKWASVLEALGHTCFYFAGECDRPPERSLVVPEAHFKHPTILRLTEMLFSAERRPVAVSSGVQDLKEHLKDELCKFLKEFDIYLLVVENALSLPVNIPLGLALTEVIAETYLPTLAHHHDFYWERKRFSISAAGDYLRTAFPPTLPAIQHVVINSFAARQLALRTGASSILIPNVMDFEDVAEPSPDHVEHLRQTLGLAVGEHLLLQPTRVVPRKRIELAIEFARRLELPCTLVITHASGDEGSGYEAFLRDYARLMGVRVIFASDLFNHARGLTPDGRPVFSLRDAYHACSLVTYPSLVEGFGNAFLEAIYYRRPILMSTYEIFRTDIQPKGFRVIGFDDFIGTDTLEHARQVLRRPQLAAEMTERNFAIGKRHYSFHNLERALESLTESCASG